MRSKNPVLTRTAPGNPYGARPPGTRLVDLDAVVTRTAVLFAVLVISAGVTFFAAPGAGVLIAALLVATGLGFWITLSTRIRPAAILAYSVFEGVVVGAVSTFYADYFGGNVVPQAVVGTLGAFAAMLVAYKTGLVRATPKFKKTMLIATLGYLAFAVIHLAGVLVGAWDSIYIGPGASLLGVIASLVGVVLAALYLVLDFDQIEDSIRRGAPEEFAWRLAFGLIVTLVWLYLEILRLVGLMQGRD